MHGSYNTTRGPEGFCYALLLGDQALPAPPLLAHLTRVMTPQANAQLQAERTASAQRLAAVQAEADKALEAAALGTVAQLTAARAAAGQAFAVREEELRAAAASAAGEAAVVHERELAHAAEQLADARAAAARAVCDADARCTDTQRVLQEEIARLSEAADGLRTQLTSAAAAQVPVMLPCELRTLVVLLHVLCVLCMAHCPMTCEFNIAAAFSAPALR